MKTFKSVDEILHFAVSSAQETAHFFTSLSKQARNARLKQEFEKYAREEFAYMVRLAKVREIAPLGISGKQLKDLVISDYQIDLNTARELKYSEALVMAMRKVRASLKLYLDIASRTPNDEIQSVFRSLANEEAKHKRRFEIEYNESILLR
ncbi:MAG: ferritin family protein [Bacteroidales bacterium]|nr:ferritin family protein [Bacteroidales bacterium]